MSSRLCGLAALLAVTGLLGAACGSVNAGHSAGPAVAARATSPTRSGTASGWPVTRGTGVKSAIVIDPSINETFAPPPARARPKLNALQALNALIGGSREHKLKAIPAHVSYQLGLLTLPSVTAMLVWGYSSPPGPCLTTGPPPRAQKLGQPASPPPPTPHALKRCIEWTFIDASNPRNNYGTWQPVGRRR